MPDSKLKSLPKIFMRLFIAAAVLLSFAAIFASWKIFSGEIGSETQTNIIDYLIYVDSALISFFSLIIIYHLITIWRNWRKKRAGARLHIRLVILFSLLAATPALLVAVFSYLFLEVGVNAWFSEKTRTALTESSLVAAAYLKEHERNITADALRMARDTNNDTNLINGNEQFLERILEVHAQLRNISEAIIFEASSRKILARAGFSLLLELDPLPTGLVEQAKSGEVVIVNQDYDDRVRALIKLDIVPDGILYIGRLVDPKVLSRIEATRGAVAAYEALSVRLPQIRLSFGLNFALVGLLLLMGGIWVGLVLANRISIPLSRLIDATKDIAEGRYNSQVILPQTVEIEELLVLSTAFNRMAFELERQRFDLLTVNENLEIRRKFTEAVLSGVSSGVIGLNQNQEIDLPNRLAGELLNLDLTSHIGTRLDLIVPEMTTILKAAKLSTAQNIVEDNLEIKIAGEVRQFLVRIIAENTLNEDYDEKESHKGNNSNDQFIPLGYVITFDDISPLMDAQRQAAWADVARRIAHEIKNPLTPIQLSAERLERKYLPQILQDKDTYQILIATIIRQVGDIQRMVDEFSSFARMPIPQFSKFDVNDICRQAIFLQKSAHPDISFINNFEATEIEFIGDSHQFSQLLNNLLKNAVEAVTARHGEKGNSGEISVSLKLEKKQIVIEICDNGIGLPEGVDKRRLSEPYVTTRAKGTGLGLAIVRKIIEDHGGQLSLSDRKDGITGCMVRATLSRELIHPPENA